MPGPYSTESLRERVVLAGAITFEQPEKLLAEYLDELSFLVETAGGEPVRRFVQRLDSPHPRTFLGSGKLAEMARFIEEHAIDLAVFDDELSATQLRNIEGLLKCKVLDRTNLILDIFAQRARTAHAKVQVELAQLQYLLPRLTRMWTHLERQRGGIGLRGPGETELETDRRIIRTKISLLKQQLADFDRQMETQRKNRRELVRVALVGYTNVGKSTIMNLLARAEVFAENKLFATLDTTVRKINWENMPFLLSDTVGFIRKLPHNLVESFKSTLDEVREADVLVHVVDVSHQAFEHQFHVVNQTLEEIKAGDKPVLVVFNKTDLFRFEIKDPDDLTPSGPENVSLEELQQTWMAKIQGPCVFISARNQSNITEFRSLISRLVEQAYQKKGRNIPSFRNWEETTD